jgi:nitrite reductase (NADH) large subunit
VVIEDSLGIGETLENQMSQVIGKYQCEWKTTIENPEALKRFRQFVNSDKQDTNIQFVNERDQIRPARDHEKIQVVNISDTTDAQKHKELALEES